MSDTITNPGNAAALRVKMERICAASILAAKANAPEWVFQRMADIHAMARAALAAPARNCDRYATWDKAWDAFSKSYFGPTDPGELEYHFGVWLFAKEGTP